MTFEDAARLCQAAELTLLRYSGKAQREKSLLRCDRCGHEFEMLVGLLKSGKNCFCRKTSPANTSQPTLKLQEPVSESATTKTDDYSREVTEIIAEAKERNQKLAQRRKELRKLPIPDGIEIDCMLPDSWHARCTVCGNDWWAPDYVIKAHGCVCCRLEKEFTEPFTEEELSIAAAVTLDEILKAIYNGTLHDLIKEAKSRIVKARHTKAG